MVRYIPLTQDKYALVDDDVYAKLIKYNWHAHKHRNTYYARHNMWVNGKCITVRMHHEIIEMQDGYVIDHINGNGLDNRRENLRLVSVRQNNQNLHIAKSSIFPGVCWDSNRRKWKAYIKIHGKTKFLGRYTNELEAFNAYKIAVEKLTSEPILRDFEAAYYQKD